MIRQHPGPGCPHRAGDAEHLGVVAAKTKIGGERVVDMMSGEQLPRIC
jgi:hydrogenase maturation factor